MDIIIMAELKNDVISFTHNKFNLFVSSGRVYSLLYKTERDIKKHLY
jgi:hypothetical protein